MIINEETLAHIEGFLASLNAFRDSAQVASFSRKVIRYENGQIARVVIHCPFNSLAFQLLAFLDAVSFLWVSLEGNDVIIQGLYNHAEDECNEKV